MSSSPATCSLGLTSAHLSAWRDDTLEPAERERIERHLPSCSTCQATLQHFTMIATVLRKSTEPDLRDPMWRGIQTRLGRPITIGPQRRQVLSRVGAFLALVVIIFLATQIVRFVPGKQSKPVVVTLTGGATALPSPTLTPTLTPPPPGMVVPGPHPQWRVSHLPAGDHLTTANSLSLGIAPSDGNTAYYCVVTLDSPTTSQAILVTHDRGASWQQVSTLAEQGEGCHPIVVDALNPQTVAVAIAMNHTYVSFTGGKTWQAIAPGVTIESLAIWHGQAFALIQQGTPYLHLAVSHDNLQSWQNIDSGVIPPSDQAFWLNPFTGEIVLEAADASLGGDQLWITNDSGSHWHQMMTPFPPSARENVGGVGTDQHLHLCIAHDNASPPFSFACTADDGNTWITSPTLGGTALAITPDAVTGDGTLIAYGVSTTQELYRWAAHTNTWQDLGPFADTAGWVQYVPTTTGGVLWNLPSIPKDDDTRFATATYP